MVKPAAQRRHRVTRCTAALSPATGSTPASRRAQHLVLHSTGDRGFAQRAKALFSSGHSLELETSS
jgi:hypothetical protein